jgi:hypothetical protein
MSRIQPKVGFVSLGCPKALVDSERILTQLKVEGYGIVPTYDDADLVVVNTCGFIDAAVAESLDAIGEAMAENGKVVVTGCLGAREGLIREKFPDVLSISGPQDYASVMKAVHAQLPPKHDPFFDLVPPTGIKLTPKHYAYLKISEGCNHRCTFCIIPSMRGDLVSRPIDEVLVEAEKLAKGGVKELLVISQDTSAYGVDVKYAEREWRGKSYRTRMTQLCEALAELGIWVRLHYVYPYPHVDEIIPLMAEGKLLPYLDIPFQHASPRILKLMKRPGARGEQPRAHQGVARDLSRAHDPLDVHRRLPGRNRSRVRGAARVPERGGARPCRRVRVFAGRRREGERAARSGARGRQAGAPEALHGRPGEDLEEAAEAEGRHGAEGADRRGGSERRGRTQHGRRARGRRQGLRRGGEGPQARDSSSTCKDREGRRARPARKSRRVMRYVAPPRELVDPATFEHPVFARYAAHRDLLAGPAWPDVETLNARLADERFPVHRADAGARRRRPALRDAHLRAR